MRIIAGEYASRVLKTLKGMDTTRPTLDKIKEAIFSSVGPYFDGGRCLDLFAGSGAIGLECLSRGMDYAIFVDHNYEAIQVIKENVQALKVSNCSVLKMSYERALQECSAKNEVFDFIYIDPPYALEKIEKILSFIDEHHLLSKTGTIVCESKKEDSFPEEYTSFKKKKEAIYGITRITYYKGDQK